MVAKRPAKKAAPKGKSKGAGKAKASVQDTPENHTIPPATQKQLERLHLLKLLNKAAKPGTKPSVNGVDLSGEGKRGSAAKDF